MPDAQRLLTAYFNTEEDLVALIDNTKDDWYERVNGEWVLVDDARSATLEGLIIDVTPEVIGLVDQADIDSANLTYDEISQYSIPLDSGNG